jgi:prepilin-type N-terminal cleavage/methylation domain-containing protein
MQAFLGADMRRHKGFTLIELLIVIAIIGIILGIGVVNGQRMAKQTKENASPDAIRNLIWQGATSAASRGANLVMVRTGDEFIVRTDESTVASRKILYRYELPQGMTSTFNNTGHQLVFLPPGKVDFSAGKSSLPSSSTPNSFQLTASGKTYTLQVSIIGDIQVTQ